MEIEPDPVGAQLGAGDGFVDARQAADLHADHGRLHSLGLHARTQRKAGSTIPAIFQGDEARRGLSLKRRRTFS